MNEISIKRPVYEEQPRRPRRKRSDEEISDALRRMCDTVWGPRPTTPPFWTIPVNHETDVDVILYDAFAELQQLRRYRTELESLVPMGSEFVDEPERIARHVRDRLESRGPRRIVELEAVLRDVRDFLRTHGYDITLVDGVLRGPEARS